MLFSAFTPLQRRLKWEIGLCASYHSSQLHRFFANRYHKKVCPKCSRPNILPSMKCAFCCFLLNDGHIHPVGRDFLRELVLQRKSNHDQTSELCRRISEWMHRKHTPTFNPPLALLEGLPRVCREVKGNQESGVEFVRCFDYIVVGYPFPVSFLHLVAVPKGSFYDIRQLRRVHTTLLKSMADKLKQLSGILLRALVVRRHQDTADISRLTLEEFNSSEGTKSKLATEELELIKRSLILGFNYPSEYGQLCMHAVVPPIRNPGLFESPFFYPLKKVIRDLEHRGSVQPHPHSDVFK